MWNALSKCYKAMGKNAEAMKCNERAERFKDKEGIALHKLAKLYVDVGDLDKAAICFQINLKRKEMETTTETSEAMHFLAQYYKQQGKYPEALQYAKKLHERCGSEREEAGVLIKEISYLIQQQQQQHHRQ